ncbi:hypothetical protein [Streptomyces sp. UG1]|uniref:hypothetical protein n=1 Tax=Streptomyces sp. UG1 TaxID=3417652 RepID=UPI003CF3FF3D
MIFMLIRGLSPLVRLRWSTRTTAAHSNGPVRESRLEGRGHLRPTLVEPGTWWPMKPARVLSTVVSAVVVATLCGGSAEAAQPAPGSDYVIQGGINLSEFYGVSERMISVEPECREALAGERWVLHAGAWATAPDGDDAVYPAGYEPEEHNPIDDFNAKFTGARVVLDRGTSQQRTFTFDKEQILRTGRESDGLPFSGIVSPPFRPLRVGTHTFTVTITMRERHCDGLDTDPQANCLPAGPIEWAAEVPFEVFPRSG